MATTEAINGRSRRRTTTTPAPGEAQSGRVGWLLLAPGLFLFIAVMIVPIIQTGWRSLYLWDGITPAEWIGFGNYVELVSDRQVRSALLHSAILSIFNCAIPVSIGLLLAVSLSRTRIRGLQAFRTFLFLPQVISGVAIGIIWKWMYDPSLGPINNALSAVGLEEWRRAWLGDFKLALPAVGIVGTWATIGFCMVLFLAGLQKIPQSLYDAARVDGANWWRELWAVTLPGLRNELVVAVTITLIITLRVFDIVYVTTHGGPGDQTTVPSLLIYLRAFTYGLAGNAAALAMVMAAIILTISVTVNRLGEKQ
jgi:raffinose/stachyose/melibiose transport system permease protein